MSLKEKLNYIVMLGTDSVMPVTFYDRIRIINKFSLLCIIYTIPYIIFSVIFKFYSSAIVFTIAQFLFILSLYYNHTKKFPASKIAVIIATNFSVFYLSLFYGYGSGFHLYYYTSPLIMLSLFGLEDIKNFIAGMSAYLISVILLVLFHIKGVQSLGRVSSQITDILYTINIFLAMSFCILIAVNFAYFYKKVHFALLDRNETLEKSKARLEVEINERKIAEVKLQDSLNEIAILLSETHHRVKNNLAVISGMLDLQMISNDDENITAVLSACRNRIKSMSLIHESFYQHENLSKIEFSIYLKTLTNEIRNSYSSLVDPVVINISSEPLLLPINKAIPCGLLINEVLSNIFKHAFHKNKNGIIDIVLKRNEEFVLLEIKDNGVGFVEGDENKGSLGMSLIKAFVKQLKGDHKYIALNGTIFQVKFII